MLICVTLRFLNWLGVQTALLIPQATAAWTWVTTSNLLSEPTKFPETSPEARKVLL